MITLEETTLSPRISASTGEKRADVSDSVSESENSLDGAGSCMPDDPARGDAKNNYIHLFENC